jgi:hypothetical protein
MIKSAFSRVKFFAQIGFDVEERFVVVEVAGAANAKFKHSGPSLVSKRTHTPRSWG